MSSRAAKSGPRAGFTLIEALVALVVAGFLLPSLGRALGQGWTATRTPMEVVSAMTLAGDVAAGGAVPAEARRLGFGAERTGGAVTVLILPSDVAPAPLDTGAPPPAKGDAGSRQTDASLSGMKLAPPTGLGAPPAAAPANLVLRRVTVVVRTPSGRRLTLDTVRLDDATR